MNQDQATQSGPPDDLALIVIPLAEWERRSPATKTLVEDGTDRILGAHLLGGQADEVINLFALAIRSGVPAKNLKDMLFAYPSHVSDIPYMF